MSSDDKKDVVGEFPNTSPETSGDEKSFDEDAMKLAGTCHSFSFINLLARACH
jgi:hypothetical protein